MANRFQTPNEAFFTNETTPDGIIVSVPLSGGKLQFFASGTSTPQLVFEDSLLTIPRTNPVILDSAGQAGSIFLSTSPYKVVLEDADANIIWTEDPVTAADSSALSPSGGTLTGTLNFIMGQSVEASTLTNIWTLTDGNSRHITGNGATITSFGTPVQAGQWQRLIFDGSVTLKNGANLVVPGGADYTTQPGDIFDATTDFSGATLLGPYALASGKAISGGGGGGSGGTVCIDADGRNIVAKILTSTTLSLTASEIIAKTGFGGTSYLGSSLSTSLNFGIVGANGIDTGAIAASKFYGLYWIYNPTTNVWASLASLSFTAPTLPSGYTAFALIGVVPTNASTAVVTDYTLYGRACSFQRINIFNGTNSPTALTAASIAAAVPTIAKTVNGIIGQASGPNTGFYAVASSSGGSGLQEGPVPNNSSAVALNNFFAALTFISLQLQTAQTIFWQEVNGGQPSRLDITGFTI